MRTGLMHGVVGGLTLILAAGCAAGGTGERKMSAKESIEARQRLMKDHGAAWKSVQEKAKAGQIAAIVPDAEKLITSSRQIPALFPEGSLDPANSAAKPEIWQRRAEFDAAAKNMEAWSVKLRDAAKSGDATATQAVVKDYGRQACGTCHQPFRVPPKQ